MLAYKKQDILNREYRDAAKAAMKAGILTEQENTILQNTYPASLYTPNLFLRLGLGVLTLIISLALLGLFLLEISSGNNYQGVIFIVGSMSLVALEVAIHIQKTFQAGIDDVLLHSGIAYILCSIGLRDSTNPAVGEAVLSLLACLLYLFAFIRYLDRLAAVFALAGFAFFLHAIIIALLHWPLWSFLTIGALAMASLFLLVRHLLKNNNPTFYLRGLQLLQYALAICGYGCFHLAAAESLYAEYPNGNDWGNPQSPMLVFYWSWTILVPILILLRGIFLRSRPWIRIGIVLLLSLLVFIQMHEHPIPDELAAFIIGLLLVVLTYFIIKFLKTNDSVFNDRPGSDSAGLNSLVPALLIGSLHPATANQAGNHTQFGGGSFGGGGAEGEF
jgi:hypothetical protein